MSSVKATSACGVQRQLEQYVKKVHSHSLKTRCKGKGPFLSFSALYDFVLWYCGRGSMTKVTQQRGNFSLAVLRPRYRFCVDWP